MWHLKSTDQEALNKLIEAIAGQRNDIESLRTTPEYSAAVRLANHIFDLWPRYGEGKYGDWWAQMNRSTMSVANNLAEAWSKNMLWPARIARGEAYEVLTGVQFAPMEVKEKLSHEAELMVRTLDEALEQRWLGQAEAIELKGAALKAVYQKRMEQI